MSPVATRRRRYSPRTTAAVTPNVTDTLRTYESTRRLSASPARSIISHLAKDTADLPQPRRSSRLADIAKKKSSNVRVEPYLQSTRVTKKAQSRLKVVSEPNPRTSQQSLQHSRSPQSSVPPPKAASLRLQQVTPSTPHSQSSESGVSLPPAPSLEPQQVVPEGTFGQLLQTVLPASLKVHPWLSTLAPRNPPELQSDIEQIYNMPNDTSVPNSSTVPTTGVDTNATSGKSTKSRLTPAQRAEQLQAHNVVVKPRTERDSVAEEIATAMKQQIIPSSKQLDASFSIMRDCLEQQSRLQDNLERYRLFEKHRNELNKALPDLGSFTITAEDFDKDKLLAKDCQEAFVQRIILPSILDRWRLDKSFTYDFEASWQVATEHLLTRVKSTSIPDESKKKKPKSDELKNPKPDLTVYFSFDSICHHAAAIEQLYCVIDSGHYRCVHPDGEANRCFPFLFIEAKRGDDTIRKYASLDCMHEASQALQNIYACMKKAGMASEIEKVRVFSISINALHCDIRVHYATKTDYDPNLLVFKHTMAGAGISYNRDIISKAVNSILRDHALPVLKPILESTFERFTRVLSAEKFGQSKAEKMFGVRDLSTPTIATREAVMAAEGVETTNGAEHVIEDTETESSVPESAPASRTRSSRRRNSSGETRHVAKKGKKHRADPAVEAMNQPTNTSDSFGASSLAV